MSGSGSQKQKTEISLPDFYKPYWQQAMGGAQGLFQSGQLNNIVPMSDATQAGLNSNLALANNIEANINPQIQKSYLDLLSSNLVGSSELGNAISAATSPIQQQLSRYAIPATQDSAIAAGQFGSSRQGIAEGLARSDANQQMGNIGSQLAWQALLQDQQNKQFGVSSANSVMAALQNPSMLRTNVGGIQEGYAQEQADSAKNNLLAYLQLVQAMNPGVNSVTTAKTSTSPFQKLASLGSLGLGVAGLMSGAGPLAMLAGGAGAASGAAGLFSSAAPLAAPAMGAASGGVGAMFQGLQGFGG